MTPRLVAALAAAAALAGCATGRRGSEEPEFVGRSMSVAASSGEVTTLRFRHDGSVTARFGEQETQGRWNLESERLCFTWRETFRECWPYTEPFRRGRTVTVRSDRGNVVQVTLR